MAAPYAPVVAPSTSPEVTVGAKASPLAARLLAARQELPQEGSAEYDRLVQRAKDHERLERRPMPKAVPDHPYDEASPLAGTIHVPPDSQRDFTKVKPPVIPEETLRSSGVTYDDNAIGTWVTGAAPLSAATQASKVPVTASLSSSGRSTAPSGGVTIFTAPSAAPARGAIQAPVKAMPKKAAAAQQISAIREEDSDGLGDVDVCADSTWDGITDPKVHKHNKALAARIANAPEPQVKNELLRTKPRAPVPEPKQPPKLSGPKQPPNLPAAASGAPVPVKLAPFKAPTRAQLVPNYARLHQTTSKSREPSTEPPPLIGQAPAVPPARNTPGKRPPPNFPGSDDSDRDSRRQRVVQRTDQSYSSVVQRPTGSGLGAGSTGDGGTGGPLDPILINSQRADSPPMAVEFIQRTKSGAPVTRQVILTPGVPVRDPSTLPGVGGAQLLPRPGAAAVPSAQRRPNNQNNDLRECPNVPRTLTQRANEGNDRSFNDSTLWIRGNSTHLCTIDMHNVLDSRGRGSFWDRDHRQLVHDWWVLKRTGRVPRGQREPVRGIPPIYQQLLAELARRGWRLRVSSYVHNEKRGVEVNDKVEELNARMLQQFSNDPLVMRSLPIRVSLCYDRTNYQVGKAAKHGAAASEEQVQEGVHIDDRPDICDSFAARWRDEERVF